HGLHRAASRDLLPPRDRLGRADRAAMPGREPAVQGRQGAVPGDRQGHHRRRVRGLRQGHRQSGDRRHARRPRDRPTCHRPDRRGDPGLLARGDALGDRGRDAPAPDPVRGHRRGDARRRRTIDQLLMAATKPKAGTSDLAASVSLTDDDLIGLYRVIATARAVDERMWILNRAGRIPFVISGQGHEGAQAAIAWPLEKKKDWIAPFYRSIATCLTFGMQARDILTAQYAKAIDPSSGGRQMPGHYGNVANNLVSLSSPVATQMLHAVGIALAAKIRKTGQVAMTSMGEGSSNQGDVHEGLNFAAIHELPFILCVENNGYAISVPVSKQLALPDVAARAAG